MRMVDLIEAKKHGQELTQEEIQFIIKGYIKGDIPDYQMSALFMAIYFNPLNFRETLDLTLAMRDSGDVNDLSDLGPYTADKHSTGGVGDKTTLVVAPMASALGLNMAKMSGRGLGHTGGTLDKLESIPGFNVNLTAQEFKAAAKTTGIAVVGQSGNLDPADKLMYALRDVTGTIDCKGLIASSIMSKKLAAGTRNILLDVKVGSGSFMKTIEDAKELAKIMVRIGNEAGVNTQAILSDMEQPLGDNIGNSLEVMEAIETLKGRGSQAFRSETAHEAALLVSMAGLMPLKEAEQKALESLDNGQALAKFKEMVMIQGGDTRVIDDYHVMAISNRTVDVKAEKTGHVAWADALKLGEASLVLGAGRATKTDSIDHSVGIILHKHVGDYVRSGEALATLYIGDKNVEEAKRLTQEAFIIQKNCIDPRPLSFGTITKDDLE